MEKKFNFVYVTTNLINGKQYVGDYSTNDIDSYKSIHYLGSGRPHFINALKKYGKENFKREILEFFPTKKEAYNAQEKYIKIYNTLTPNGYNISPKGGYGVNESYLNEETKKKISISLMNHSVSEETKEKMRKNSKGVSRGKGKQKTAEHRTNIGKGVKGKGKKHVSPMSEEHKRKLSLAHKGNIPWNKGIPMQESAKEKMIKNSTGVSRNKGKHRTEEQKEHLRIINTGKKQSPETIEKRKKTMGAPWNKGKKLRPLSKEHKNKIRE